MMAESRLANWVGPAVTAAAVAGAVQLLSWSFAFLKDIKVEYVDMLSQSVLQGMLAMRALRPEARFPAPLRLSRPEFNIQASDLSTSRPPLSWLFPDTKHVGAPSS